MPKPSVILLFVLLFVRGWLCSTGFHCLSQQKRCRHSTARHAAAARPTTEQQQHDRDKKGIRLNKVFKATHSRRAADSLIASGRVTINDVAVSNKGGSLVIPFVDVIKLDGKIVTGWESLNGIERQEGELGQIDDSTEKRNQSGLSTRVFEYVKYWKPRGVTCTTDRKIPYNIIDEIQRDGYNPKHRVYPVGRLDKDTSGLILLTSDGRLPNASLRKKQKQPKIYEVFVDRPFQSRDLERLRNGIVITTVAQRDRKAKPLTAKTRPCLVKQIDDYGVEMTLFEGRNRQIRKMMAALDYEVVELHRVSFSGISLSTLRGPGSWKRLDGQEMKLIRKLLSNAATTEMRDLDE